VKRNFPYTGEKDDHTPRYRTNFASLSKREGLEKYPSHFEVINREVGIVCQVSRKGNGPYLGNLTYQYYGEEKVTIEGEITGTKIDIRIQMNNLVEPQASLKGTYP